MRGDCRRDVDITRSTGAGRDRVVSDASAMVQGQVRWVACTESSCGAGGRDGCVRRECRRDVAGTGSTGAGRDRVVSDGVEKFQRHLHWVACTESSCGAGGGDGWVRGECRRDVDITRSTEAGLERVAWMPQRSFKGTCAGWRARKAAVARAGAMGGCVASVGVTRTLRAAPRSRRFRCRSDGSEARLAQSGQFAMEIQFSLERAQMRVEYTPNRKRVTTSGGRVSA